MYEEKKSRYFPSKGVTVPKGLMKQILNAQAPNEEKERIRLKELEDEYKATLNKGRNSLKKNLNG